ncbi:MAG: TldD/PmbA family protein, partial [Okeania sp. SIO2D1]|nr:TldD/PmbA family protein [Okeania sp. SIO2D1]
MTTAIKQNLLSEDEALSLLETTIKKSEAEGIVVSLNNDESFLSRYSENQISQNITKTKFELNITSYFGTRSATASTTELDPDAITATIRSSEELARIAPQDPEWVPLLEPQEYEKRTPAFDELTATISPLERGKIIQQVCAMSTKAGVDGSGTLSTDTFLGAIANRVGD